MLMDMLLPVFITLQSSASNPISYSDFQSIFSGLTEQISVSSIVGVLAAVVGVCVGLVFMWWGIRKVVRMLMSAFRKGKVSV